MTAAPSRRVVNAPDGVVFRALDYAYDSYRDLFHRVGQDWLWYGRLQRSDAELAAHFADPGVHLYTLTQKGTDEALLELDFSKKSVCELAYFGLSPALMGIGAGHYLMHQALRLAWEKPIERVTLNTCQLDSPAALPFYIRSGFTPCGRSVEIDDDPRNSGALPETAAPQVPLIR